MQIACISKNGTNPAYEGARIGVSRLAEDMGYDVWSRWPLVPDDPAEQSQLIKEAIAAKPDGFLIATAHQSKVDEALKDAREAGIPVVSFVSQSAAVPPACFVTSDNYDLAYAIAGFMIAHIGGAGRLAIIEGNPNSETSGPRTQGFLDAIKAAPHIELAAQAVGYYLRDPAADAMRDILADGPAPDGILVANDFMALGVIDTLKSAGLSIPVVSVNAVPDAIQALKSGDLLATAAFDAMKIASTAMLALDRILHGKPVPPTITLPVDIVTAETCAEWDKNYQHRPLPKWREVVED